MALTVNSKPPTTANAKKATLTVAQLVSDTITAPPGSRIWAFVGWDTTSSTGNDFNFSSSPTRTWTKALVANTGAAAGAIAWADAGPSGFTGTITVDSVITPPYAGATLYILVVSGGEAVPQGATAQGVSNITTTALTPTSSGSIIAGMCTDWYGDDPLTLYVMPSGLTLLDWNDAGSAYSDGFYWKGDATNPTPTVAGVAQSIYIQGTSSGNTFAVEIRGTQGPTLTAELWESGVKKADLGTASVSVDGVYVFNWDAASLADPTGAGVELRLSADASTDFGAIEWAAATSPVSGYSKTGNGALSLVGSGADVHVNTKTGSGVLTGAAGGAKGVEHVKSGISALQLVGSGPDSTVHPKTGAGALTLAAGGTKTVARTYDKTGSGVLSLAAGGVQAQAHQVAKTGAGALQLVGSGADVHVNTKTGSGPLSLVGSGADSTIHAKTGSGVLTWVGFGPDSTIHPKTGGAALTLVGSGGKALNKEWVKANFGFLTFTSSGAKVVIHPKTGTGVLSLTGSGTGVKAGGVYAKAGSAPLTLVGTGPETRIVDKTGVGALILTGAGADAVERIRAGAGAMVLRASGTKAVTRTWQKSGTGVMGGSGVDGPGRIIFVNNRTVRVGRSYSYVL